MQGSEIKGLRLSMSLSQEEFGKLLGYQKPQVRVSEIERGVREVSNQVVTICKLLQENAMLKADIQAIQNIINKYS